MNDTKEKSPNFVTGKEASRLLGISESTLRRYADNGKIQFIRDTSSPMSHRRYNINDFFSKQSSLPEPIKCDRQRFAYCRVSTPSQRDDLNRQIQYIKDRFPNHKIIRDIGSGLNFKRRGLKTLLDYAIKGQVQELVVAHKDRLARFGFDLLEYLFKELSDAPIVVLEQENHSTEYEMVQDVLSILNVFSAKANGLRKYKKQINDEFKHPDSDSKTQNETQFATKKNLE